VFGNQAQLAMMEQIVACDHVRTAFFLVWGSAGHARENTFTGPPFPTYRTLRSGSGPAPVSSPSILPIPKRLKLS
jgi:hypothetical protein